MGWILAILHNELCRATPWVVDHTWHSLVIGIGMWLGTIMWFNVWFIIWPNQKKIFLGIVEASADEKKPPRAWPAWPRASIRRLHPHALRMAAPCT